MEAIPTRPREQRVPAVVTKHCCPADQHLGQDPTELVGGRSHRHVHTLNEKVQLL